MTSSALKTAAYAQFTNEVLLAMCRIFGTGFDDFYICNNPVSITSNGIEYNPFPLTIQLPDDAGDVTPVMKFSVSAISREVIQQLRLAQDAIYIQINLVLASLPDTIEMTFPTMRLRNVEFDPKTLSGDLILGDFLSERHPTQFFTPGNFPALFKA